MTVAGVQARRDPDTDRLTGRQHADDDSSNIDGLVTVTDPGLAGHGGNRLPRAWPGAGETGHSLEALRLQVALSLRLAALCPRNKSTIGSGKFTDRFLRSHSIKNWRGP